MVLFVVQRTDCEAFAASHDLDTVFARTLAEVAERGVEVLVYACEITPAAKGAAAPAGRRRLPWRRG